MTQALTANRLDDGRVVFLTPGGDWSPDLNDACTARDHPSAAALSNAGDRAEANCAVVGPYLIEVTEADGRIRAIAIREAIRANGPTIQAGHN